MEFTLGETKLACSFYTGVCIKRVLPEEGVPLQTKDGNAAY